jgi:hypothetical protein
VNNGQNQERRIKSENHMSNIPDGQKAFMTFKKAEHAVKAEQNRQKGAKILSDDPDFPGFPVVLADAQIIQRPKK